MFNWVHGNKRIVQVTLGLLVLPFAFWGVESYNSMSNLGADVASVGSQKISEQEFNEALRQQQDRMRSMLGRNYNPALFDTPEMRKELLDGMIAQRLLTEHAVRSQIAVSDEQLREVIGSIPAFHEDGKFSNARYETLLRAEGYTPASFESSLRRDLMLQQLTGALAESGIVSKSAAGQLAALQAQQREVTELVVSADAMLGQLKISPEMLRAYYDKNTAEFQTPENVSVEYVVLDNDALLALEQPIGADEIKEFYDKNGARFGEPEQRQASHILIGFKPDASDADKAKARAKAEQLLAQVRKTPASFAELAKKNSDDPGSAAKGGDLGYFARGMMVPSFEDAAFRLKTNEISGVVQSDFGYHIIKLTGVKPGKTKTVAEARPEIERELKKQHAGKRYAELAEGFSNTVYEQAESLKAVAEKYKLPVRKADGLTRESAPVPALNNSRMLGALFAEDALKNRRNTEAIEAGPNTLVAARVVEHRPARARPFDEVKEGIAKTLTRQESLAVARKRGAERLVELKKAGASAAMGPAKLVSRENAQGLRPEALTAVFRADAGKLPAFVGVDVPNGYAVYRVNKVIEAKPDEARQRSTQTELGRAFGAQEFKAFLAGLRANTKVVVDAKTLEKKGG